MSAVVGFTTTIPVEILFAAGRIPCDLNNVFVTDPEPTHFIEIAERDGFPRNMCNWIKGIYGVVAERGIDTVVTVLEGDCSNTRALDEILRYKGVQTIPFSYPWDRDRETLRREIRKFQQACGASDSRLAEVDAGVHEARRLLSAIDRMSWEDDRIAGKENHLWQVSASDMGGDYRAFSTRAAQLVTEAEGRMPLGGIRLGYIGVPPITSDLYECLEELGGRVVYNEVQRQFAIPAFSRPILDRYLDYTYPYGIFVRLEDIKAEIERRRVVALIHYVQAFCYRVVEDLILRSALELPLITIEGDLPGPLDPRTRVRLQAFMEMLAGKVDGAGKKTYNG